MNVEYINPFTQATFDVLSVFGTFDPKLEKPALAGEALSSEGIAVVVGIIGEVKGQVVYTYSEDTARVIDDEISILIEGQYQRAIKLLEDNKDKLNQLADILIEKEVIFKDDLETIFGERSFNKVEELVEPTDENLI